MVENRLPRLATPELSEAGIFTWNIETDTVFGDSAIAHLFDMTVDDALSGQPIAAYLKQIHPDDLANVAGEIREAIATGAPYQCQYRVLGDGEIYRNVEAFGRCFRSRDGQPVQYAGIVFPFDASDVASDPLLDACAAALRIAVGTGRDDLAAKLGAIVHDLQGTRPLLN
jgi:PAS domain-containing protein